nr:YjzC family protein [uncultured Methylophaga sp.]
MAKKSIRPGQNTGPNGGIYQEVGPRGGKRSNYATIPDNHSAPPTTKPNSSWEPVRRTPDSKR